MQEMLRELGEVLKKDISQCRNHPEKLSWIFPKIRIFYVLGKIGGDAQKEYLKAYFSSCMKDLTVIFKKTDDLARDEKTRIALGNFLSEVQQTLSLENHEIPLTDEHKHHIEEPFEKLSHTSAEDPLGYLFGPENAKGYNYGAQTDQLISQKPVAWDTKHYLQTLLKFSLPFLSRRMAQGAFAEEDFFRNVVILESFITALSSTFSDTEKKLIFRFYMACHLYQQKKLIRVLKTPEEFLAELKALDKQYPEGSVLKQQHLVLLLERAYKDFKPLALTFEQQVFITRIYYAEEKMVTAVKLPQSWEEQKAQLEEGRKTLREKPRRMPLFKCQEKSTEAIQKLLNGFLDNARVLLGAPPCPIALLLLGSSSRHDRLPYSDLEIALIYEGHAPSKAHETYHYVATLIALLEVQMVYLGESHPDGQGFWLDGSTSLRPRLYLRTSVETMILEGLKKKERHDNQSIPKEQNPRNIKLHSFLMDPSAYSLMQPLLVNADEDGKTLFESYQKALQAYLDEQAPENFQKELMNLLEDTTGQGVSGAGFLTKRQMIGLWVWWDVLRCLEDHVDLSKGQVDLKKALHKPIAYFLMGLRLYYGFPLQEAKNLEGILRHAVKNNLLSPWLGQFFLQLLEWEINLRLELHLGNKKQVESVNLSVLGFDLFLMLPSSSNGVLKKSDKTHLYLYKKEGRFFYIMNDIEHNLEKELIIRVLADEKFNQPSENPAKCESKEICDAVLEETSKRGHTSALSAIEEKRLYHMLLLWKSMEKAMSYYLKNLGTHHYGFELDKIMGNYFEHELQLCNSEKGYKDWFLEVTNYLLYTKALLQSHRNYYRLLPENQREHCRDSAKAYFDEIRDQAFWLMEENFWTKLWDAPLSNGERQSHQILKAKWKVNLTSLLVPVKEMVKNTALPVYIEGIKSGRLSVNPEIIEVLIKNQWMDEQGKFVLKKEHPVASRMPGNHLVIPWPLPENIERICGEKNKSEKEINTALMDAIQKSAKFYFKIYPEYPLVELFLNELIYRLGYYPPREVELWSWKSGRNDYPVLVSEAVKGKTFQESLSQNILFQLNEQAFSESVVISGLVSLEDNKPDNIILLQESEGQRLCLVDADRWFAPAFRLNQLHAKNAIFCLKQMAEKIHPVFREEFLSLNPQLLLQGWVDEMEALGNKCITIFNGKIKDYFERPGILNKDETRRTLLLPPLQFHAVNSLFVHIQNIQGLLSSSHTLTIITHSQVLSKINSRLANHYSLAREKHKKTLECFEYAAGHAYLRGKGIQQEYFTSHVNNFITQREDMWGKQEETERSKVGIEENWQKDIEIAKTQLAKFDEKEEHFNKAKEDFFLKGNFLRFLQLGSNAKEKILNELDWSKFSLLKQRELLRNLGHCLNMCIRNSEEIKDEDLKLLIQKSPGLKKLQLINCPKLTHKFLESLPEYDSSIEVILFEQLENLRFLGYLSRNVYAEKNLRFPNLKELNIINCILLEEIHIEAVQLKNVKVENSPKLKVLQTKSQSMETLFLTGNTAIPTLKKFYTFMESSYGYNLNFFYCTAEEPSKNKFQEFSKNEKKTKNNTLEKYNQHLFYPNKKIDKNLTVNLLNRLPILLFLDWTNIEETVIDELINRLNKFLFNRLINYSETSHESRKKLKNNLENILKTLNELKKKNVISNLKMTLNDKYPWVRESSLLALKKLEQNSPEVDEDLKKLLLSADKILNDSGLCLSVENEEFMKKTKETQPEVIAILIETLNKVNDSNVDARIAAMDTIEGLNQFTPEIISALIKSLDDTQSRVREKTALVIGNIFVKINKKFQDSILEFIEKEKSVFCDVYQDLEKLSDMKL